MKRYSGYVFVFFGCASMLTAILLGIEASTPYVSPCDDDTPVLVMMSSAFALLGGSWIWLGVNRILHFAVLKRMEVLAFCGLAASASVILATGTIARLLWPLTALPMALVILSAIGVALTAKSE